jgi:hypothetical protein
MGRVLKFRARRPEGTWVYTEETLTRAVFWQQVDTGRLTAVGQYTGLRDREGRPVYEGDICQYRSEETGTPYEEIGVIHWASGCFAFGNTSLCEVSLVNDRLPLMVVGNTVEHAALLTPRSHPGALH